MKGHLSLIERMKTKNFYIVVLFILATSISLWLLSYPTPSFRTIVTKTHKQIDNIKNIPSNMQMQASQELAVDPVYLRHLGFFEGPEMTLDETAAKLSFVPVIACAVEPGKVDEATTFIKSVQKFLGTYQLVLFDLGLGSSDLLLLKQTCNSTWNCVIQTLNFDKYPSHVRYLETKSYHPICIQEILNHYGAVIWTDMSDFLLTIISVKLNQTLTQAQNNGIVAWTIEDSVSSLVHPKMFRYFKAVPRDYYFLHAVESHNIVLYNTQLIHRQVMLPWVKCALIEECINPTGAQSTGCNYQRKPLFLYSGCHHYDMSALNVILGQVFSFDDSHYAGKQRLINTSIRDYGKRNVTLVTKSPHQKV